jgi:hypothetical protein
MGKQTRHDVSKKIRNSNIPPVAGNKFPMLPISGLRRPEFGNKNPNALNQEVFAKSNSALGCFEF